MSTSFGWRTIGGSPHAYLQYLLAGIMVQNSPVHDLEHRHRARHRPGQGVLQPGGAADRTGTPPLGRAHVPSSAKQAWALATVYAVAGAHMGSVRAPARWPWLAGMAGAGGHCSLCLASLRSDRNVLVATPEKVQLFGFVMCSRLTSASGALREKDGRACPGWAARASPRRTRVTACWPTRPAASGGRPGRPARGRGAALRGRPHGGVRAARGPRAPASGVSTASSVARVAPRPRWNARPSRLRSVRREPSPLREIRPGSRTVAGSTHSLTRPQQRGGPHRVAFAHRQISQPGQHLGDDRPVACSQRGPHRAARGALRGRAGRPRRRPGSQANCLSPPRAVRAGRA